MTIFYDFVYMLWQEGISEILLPFILVFAISFAILQKTGILGHHLGADNKPDKNRPKSNLNMMVALVMGLSFVIPHSLGVYPPHKDPVIIINNSLASFSVVLVAVVAILLVVATMFGRGFDLGQKSKPAMFLKLLSVGIVIYIIGGNMGWFPWYFSISRTAQTGIVAIAMFALIMSFIMKGTEKSDLKKRFPVPNAWQPTYLLKDSDELKKYTAAKKKYEDELKKLRG